MSSMECVCQNVVHKRPKEFTFTWCIHNYSYCTMEETDPLFSPTFVVEFLGNSKWDLVLYPRGNSCRGYISCFLRNSSEEPNCNFTLSRQKSCGQFKEEVEKKFKSTGCMKGYLNFLGFEELQGPDGCLINDTLTIRCRMWKTGADIPASVNLEAHSRIKVSRLDYTWVLNDISVSNKAFEEEFQRTIDITEFFIGNSPQINLLVFKNGSLSEGALHFGIEMNKPSFKKYFGISVHLIDANGRVAHSAHGEHLFECSDEKLVWNFPLISNNKFSSNKKLYLPNNRLTLLCKLSYSTDRKLETFVYRTINELELESTTIELDQQSDIQRVWMENMQQCYMDGKFSDFVIRTPDRQFSVSKNILSAHSEVFDAMFERDMKERKIGMVDIEDLDGDTVSKMLKFIYTGTLDYLDCSAAQKLYFAADKYRITALLKKCSIYLKSCLNASNVCDILEFADLHQDQDLKLRARDFVNLHAQKIVVSDAWKKLMETNTRLTCETFQWMFWKNNILNEES